MGSSTSINIHIKVENGYLVKEQKVNGALDYRRSYKITEIGKVYFNDRDWNEIKQAGYRDIQFCILDNGLNGVSECMGLFSNNPSELNHDLDQFAITKSSTVCRSFLYRPGLVYDPDNDFSAIQKEIGKPELGKLCRITYQDYNYNDEDQERCCFSNNTNKCNKNLINDYTTTHCNIVMKKKCVGNELDPKCILWLENNYKRLENSALEFYADYCSKNHSSLACNYLCRVARENEDYRSSYCDIALTNYCNKNKFESNCACVITPSNIIPDVETYLGPKECWLSACSSQPESKWLTTTQLDTRQKCNLTSCVISIDQLILKNNAKAELINDCISGSSVNSSYYLKKHEKNNIERTPGVLLYPNIALLSLSLILLAK